MKRQTFPLIRFRWIFLLDSIVIIRAVMSFGLVAFVCLDMQRENALVMLYVIPPMILAMSVSTFVILKFIRKRLCVLLEAIHLVGNGDLDVQLETKGTDEYKTVYEDFNKMVTELKSTKEEMQNFTNEFSHEFKTPITSICGFAKYLLETGSEIEIPERMKCLKIIEDESKRLAELSSNTLMLSKVEACQIITEKKDFNLCEQIKRCIILLLPKIENKKIALELDLPDSIRYYGNDELLEQVWINLLNNAVKFTPENGEITITAKSADNTVKISFSDNGIGMDGETMKHIFDKYFQGAALRKGGGNGI